MPCVVQFFSCFCVLVQNAALEKAPAGQSRKLERSPCMTTRRCKLRRQPERQGNIADAAAGPDDSTLGFGHVSGVNSTV